MGGTGAQLGASFEKAIRAVDGDPGGYVLTLKPGTEAMDLEFVYELPRRRCSIGSRCRTFVETPSPGETFTREVEVYGSAPDAMDGFVLLA